LEEVTMRVQDVMTTAVQTISPSTPAEEAGNLMRAKGIHHLVVCDGPRVVGLLSDRDIGGRHGAPIRKNRIVSDLMTERVVTVSPTRTVRQAANLMRGRSIGCLVVIGKGRTLGIVTVADLLELVGRGAERPVATAPRRLLNHRAPHRKRHVAFGAW
jgi:CBS domain-containing protein